MIIVMKNEYSGRLNLQIDTHHCFIPQLKHDY